MLIYKDIISDYELFSHVYPIKEIGAAYEVEAEIFMAKNGDIDFEVDAKAKESLEAGEVQVINIV